MQPAPGQRYPKPSTERDRWHTQYVNSDTRSPNYPRIIGRLVAGLLQQQPAKYADEPAAPPLTDGQLADLTDRAVKRATAEAVVYLRPVRVNGDWRVSVVAAGQVEAVWLHEELVEAVVWKIVDPEATAPRMVTEWFGTDDTGEWSTVSQLWNVKKHPTEHGWELTDEIVLDPANTDPLHSQLLAARNTPPRRLVPFAFDFEDGRPVPIHYTNEHLIDNLVSMHLVEDEDDAVPRNILAVAAESLRASQTAFDGGRVLGRLRGMVPGKTMLAVPGDQMSEHGTDAFVKQIHMEADLVTRDKIARKEDAFYEACGISPGTLGRQISGRSDSGAAKRADSQTTLVTIAGPARRWAHALTAVSDELRYLMGAARGTTERVQITEGLKMSAEERATLIGEARTADVMSIREGVRQINPDWDDETIDAEVAAIRVDNMIADPIE